MSKKIDENKLSEIISVEIGRFVKKPPLWALQKASPEIKKLIQSIVKELDKVK